MIDIRDATEADLPAILAIYNDAVINTTAVYDYEPRDLEAQIRWFATKWQQDLPVLAAVSDGVVTGFASYGPFRPWPAYLYTVENSVYVAPDRRGAGVGSRLLSALLDRIQQNGFHAVIAGIDATNTVSLHLHRKFGFEQVAHFREVGWKFDRWLDLVFLQRILSGPRPVRDR